ncbi:MULTISPECIES: cupin domain-containing protein [Lacticaseibacillus]|uniref:Cupin type-2 domain-containing protein n=1 Tax=Lacticaseibacillus casei DSM 20011 = JCM 1134 = ATCC 393 TaxID=1423732 RepID=A0AAD1ANS2_LACCA|nr:cupin domain-containing protein [Lacticaseibacillus casei]MBI6597078.1 cupin domain-containing protein [Lacticaseibacillus casei]MBO1480774.1 cupin domain-containing protein [Lacticaseibacillus casei]MBO2416110.1 cupin domain-containing protein [Lacticaseibacillus casei]MCK2080506.1 cupin domain-containing protein [Lacticaseibacillus casei]MDZ5496813.1 cupin domain-containing protein [Lacticaseibacillus casei]
MNDKDQQAGIFGLGAVNSAYQQYFTGKSYLKSLANAFDGVDVHVSNVTFELGCRNNWHIHHNGFQILLVTSGEGWYQAAGEPARLLRPGDVFTIHEGVKHWHGATKDSWFSHVAITKGTSEWLEPVSDQAYAQLREVK